MPIDQETLRLGLSRTVDGTDFPGLGKKYEGKVRDNYSLADGTRVLVTTDRISAFDRVLGTLPFKGQILNGLSAWWFEATKDVAPSHVLSVPDPNILHAIECEPLPVELVVRSYLTGVTSTSIWTHYAEGKRTFAGHALPDGMKKNEALPEPILTPSTKAEKGGHDVTVSRGELLAMGQISEADFDAAASLAMALFRRGQQICRERGLILVDTKYEMGRSKDGRIVVIDEIHTPDSSRYWLAASYEGRLSRGEEPESFDKEYVRRWLADVGFKGDGPIPPIPDEIRIEASRRYVEACEMVRGEPFRVDLRDPAERMADNLERAGLWSRPERTARTGAARGEPATGGVAMHAKVYVTLKREVLDPQGDAVRRALAELGFEGVRDVRIGKLVELDLTGIDRAKAEAELPEMCKKLLANPVIEDARFELE